MQIRKTTKYRILYADTDQMGVVYYGNYAKFYEMGRSEMVRQIGYTYKSLEDSGIFMPVAKVESTYMFPLYYDEEITIETIIDKLPEARMEFNHQIYNSENKLVHKAVVTLVFLKAETNRPVRAPEKLVEILEKEMTNSL